MAAFGLFGHLARDAEIAETASGAMCRACSGLFDAYMVGAMGCIEHRDNDAAVVRVRSAETVMHNCNTGTHFGLT